MGQRYLLMQAKGSLKLRLTGRAGRRRHPRARNGYVSSVGGTVIAVADMFVGAAGGNFPIPGLSIPWTTATLFPLPSGSYICKVVRVGPSRATPSPIMRGAPKSDFVNSRTISVGTDGNGGETAATMTHARPSKVKREAEFPDAAGGAGAATVAHAKIVKPTNHCRRSSESGRGDASPRCRMPLVGAECEVRAPDSTATAAAAAAAAVEGTAAGGIPDKRGMAVVSATACKEERANWLHVFL